MDKRARILVTGGAGFIGTHLMNDLIEDGFEVIGIDNYNDNLYDPKLKYDRVAVFRNPVLNIDMKDLDRLDEVFNHFRPDCVVHLGARAGVRDSYGKERLYHADNIDATQNVIDICKMYEVPQVVYASTSCVYAGTYPLPWTEPNVHGHQLNAYGWTKRVNESQFISSGLNNIGLRFFTVYGPWGRPDMALFNFTKNILEEKEIEAYNYGDMRRDFTYIGDIVAGIKTVMMEHQNIPNNDIFNIGRGKQVELMHFIDCISKELGREAKIKLAPPHPADTQETWASTKKLEDLGYKPKVNIEQGVEAFVRWYKRYYEVN